MPYYCAAAPAPGAAVAQDPSLSEAQSPVYRWLVKPTKNGIRTVLPVVDSDPNSGVSAGLMPVWVINRSSSDVIEQIHTFTYSYNSNFGSTGQYQYFLFPDSGSSALVRLGASERFDREVVTEYTNERFLDSPAHVNGRFEYSRDSSKRFFGFGPASAQSGESNYTLDTINYRVAAGVPLRKDSPWRAVITHAFQANDVTGGSVEKIPDLEARYPAVFRTVSERHHNLSLRGTLEYDTRDSAVTTTRGTYFGPFIAGASKDAMSDYNYYRYGAELRQFISSAAAGEEPGYVTALRLRFEDLRGDVPFWLLPQLGGKYSHRAYGEGRFIDHSLLLFGGEQRCRVYAAKFNGAAASFWIDPFVGYGTVAPRPQDFELKYLRPVFGTALRVVIRPVLVASADFGVGQEGLKVFLDINYSF